jgi:hypothetical protein
MRCPQCQQEVDRLPILLLESVATGAGLAGRDVCSSACAEAATHAWHERKRAAREATKTK